MKKINPRRPSGWSCQQPHGGFFMLKKTKPAGERRASVAIITGKNRAEDKLSRPALQLPALRPTGNFYKICRC